MARISTYNLDDGISVNDLLLGSSYEGTNNGNPVYATRNYRLSDLAQFFESYDFTNDISLSELSGRVTTLEGYGNHATAGYLTAHPSITAASSVDNSGSTFIQDITLDSNGHVVGIVSAVADSTDLTSFQVLTNSAGTSSLTYDNTTGDFTYTPPDLSSYLTSVPSEYLTQTEGDARYPLIAHTHDDRYYTETEVDTLLGGYLSTSADLEDLANVSTATPSNGQVLKWNSTAGHWEPSTDLQSSAGSGIALGDLSVSTQSASSTPALTYDDLTGVFSYTPPLISNFISLSSLSVGADASPSGNGGIAYNSSTGVFTYTPPNFSGSYLSTSGGTLSGDLIFSQTTPLPTDTNDIIMNGGDITGATLVSTDTINVSSAVVAPEFRGSLYSEGAGSVLVLEAGTGATPDTYYIGDLRNSDTDQVFDTSLAMFRKNLKIGDVANDLGGGAENLSLTLGATSKLYFADGSGPEHATDPYTYIDATTISQLKGGGVNSIKFERVANTGAPNDIKLVINDLNNTNTNSLSVIKGSTYITVTQDTATVPNPILSANVNSDPANGDLGLATVSYVNNKFASDASVIGWNIDGNVTTPDSVNIVLYGEDGLSFVYTADDTNNPNGYDDFQIRNSKGVESFAINDSTGVLTITKTGAGGAGGTLTANLQTYVDSRVSAGAAPSLQEVLDSTDGNTSTTDIELVGSVSTNGMLLTRRNDTGGDNLIATFDTFGNSGHIRIGSDGSNNDNTVVYGYLGMSASNNLFLSNVSSTSGGVLIDGSDNVGVGAINNTYKFNVDGTARISSTLTVEALTSLQQGINVSGTQLAGAFQVDSTTGHASFSGNLDVDGNTTLDVTTIAEGLTVTAASSLEGNVTLKAHLLADSTANQRVIGTSGSKFHEIHTSTIFATTLNNTSTSDLADKGTSTVQTFTANVVAPDFQLTSDERLKENIIDLKPRKINVDFKEYNFKDTKQTRFGVVAQEVEKHHPEFIKESDSGYKSVSYIDLLVAKIVELEDRIKQLENA